MQCTVGRGLEAGEVGTSDLQDVIAHTYGIYPIKYIRHRETDIIPSDMCYVYAFQMRTRLAYIHRDSTL